jgi:hypothetical protein
VEQTREAGLFSFRLGSSPTGAQKAVAKQGGATASVMAKATATMRCKPLRNHCYANDYANDYANLGGHV